TVGDRVEARLRPERGEPGSPDVRWHQVGGGSGLERDFEEIARVEPEDRPTIGGDVADTRKPLGEAVGGREVGGVDEVVDLPGAVALLVDRRYFHLEHEAHGHATGRRQRRCDRMLDVVTQAEQAGLGWDEFLLQFGAPDRVRKVSGRDHADTLACGPVSEALQIEVAAGRARIFRMDMQVGVEAHRMPRVSIARLEITPRFASAVEAGPVDSVDSACFWRARCRCAGTRYAGRARRLRPERACEAARSSDITRAVTIRSSPVSSRWGAPSSARA